MRVSSLPEGLALTERDPLELPRNFIFPVDPIVIPSTPDNDVGI